MNINSKNLIRLNSLSPNCSIHIHIEMMKIHENEKDIDCRISRYRENYKGKGCKKTHIIELSGNIISVYGVENPNKPTEYKITCGSKKYAIKLWNGLFPDCKVNETINGTLPNIKELISCDEFSMISMPIMISNREVILVRSLNLSWIKTNDDSILPVVNHNKVGSIKVLDDGSMIFSNYLSKEFKSDNFFLGDVDKAEQFIQLNFKDCMKISDLEAGINGLLKLNKTL